MIMLPKLDRTQPTPIYQQIQEWMRANIESGIWGEHYQLTAEDELAAQLNVNRGTLRNAIKALIDEGLLIRIHGKGTFVAPRAVEQPLADSLTTFSESLIDQHIAFETRVIAAGVLMPEPSIAAALKLEPGEPTFFLHRVRSIEGRPVTVLKNYVVARYCPGIEEQDFTQRRLFEVLEESYHLSIVWGQRTFEAHGANDEVAALLGVEPGTPVMVVRQTSYLADDTPLEASVVWIIGDSFRLSTTVRRRARAGEALTGDLREELTQRR
jgi:DNA-binding GntR family transcriptional regulator